jgi:hypothetical protein
LIERYNYLDKMIKELEKLNELPRTGGIKRK